MSQFNDTPCLTVTLSATVAKYQRVTAAGAVAGATDQDVGIATRSGVSGDEITVSAVNKQGTHKAIAAGAIAVGAKVYGATDGEVNDVQATGSFLRGVAMEAASADQDVIEILPLVGDTAGT